MTTPTTRAIDGSPINTFNIDGGVPPVPVNPVNPINPVNATASKLPGVNYTFSDFLFTLAVDSTGSPSVVYDYDDIKQSIQTILSTSPGERMMLPQFGCNVPAYVFEPCDVVTAQQLQQEIQVALQTWENRIFVQSVTVTPSVQNQAFYINIDYALVFGGTPQTFTAQLQTQTQ